MTKKIKAPIKPDTRLVTSGRDPQANHGFVNPPVYHASTLLYPTAEDQVAHRARYNYGRRGTPTSEALEDALRELDGETCAGVALLPSGLAAIAAAGMLLAVSATAASAAPQRQDAGIHRSGPLSPCSCRRSS